MQLHHLLCVVLPLVCMCVCVCVFGCVCVCANCDYTEIEPHNVTYIQNPKYNAFISHRGIFYHLLHQYNLQYNYVSAFNTNTAHQIISHVF